MLHGYMFYVHILIQQIDERPFIVIPLNGFYIRCSGRIKISVCAVHKPSCTVSMVPHIEGLKLVPPAEALPFSTNQYVYLEMWHVFVENRVGNYVFSLTL